MLCFSRLILSPLFFLVLSSLLFPLFMLWSAFVSGFISPPLFWCVNCRVFIGTNPSLPQPYVSPPDKHGWRRRFLLGFGREVSSLSRRVEIIMKINTAFLCFERTRMLVFHTSVSYFAGGRSVIWRRRWRTTPAWNGAVLGLRMIISNLVLEVSKSLHSNP